MSPVISFLLLIQARRLSSVNQEFNSQQQKIQPHFIERAQG